jgi:hypothetical protein
MALIIKGWSEANKVVVPFYESVDPLEVVTSIKSCSLYVHGSRDSNLTILIWARNSQIGQVHKIQLDSYLLRHMNKTDSPLPNLYSFHISPSSSEHNILTAFRCQDQNIVELIKFILDLLK